MLIELIVYGESQARVIYDMHVIVLLLITNCEREIITSILIWQIRKLRHKIIKQFVQGDTTSNQWAEIWTSQSGLRAWEFNF